MGQLSTLPSTRRSRCQRPFTEIGIISRSSTPRPGDAHPELSFQFLPQGLGAKPAGSLLQGDLLMCAGYHGHGAGLIYLVLQQRPCGQHPRVPSMEAWKLGPLPSAGSLPITPLEAGTMSKKPC